MSDPEQTDTDAQPEAAPRKRRIAIPLALFVLAVLFAGSIYKVYTELDGYKRSVAEQQAHALSELRQEWRTSATPHTASDASARLDALEAQIAKWEEEFHQQSSMTPDIPAGDLVDALRQEIQEIQEALSYNAEAFAHDDMRMEGIENRLDALEATPATATSTAPATPNTALQRLILIQQAVDAGRALGTLAPSAQEQKDDYWAGVHWHRFGQPVASPANLLKAWRTLHTAPAQTTPTPAEATEQSDIIGSLSTHLSSLVRIKKLEPTPEENTAPAENAPSAIPLAAYGETLAELAIMVKITAAQEPRSDELELWLDNARDRLMLQDWLDHAIAQELK